MNLKDKMASTKKEDAQKKEEDTNGKYSHNEILAVFKKSFLNEEEDSIAVRYRLRLKEPRGDQRVRISMGGGAQRDIAEVIGECVLIKERKAYHIFMQDDDIKKMFNELKERKRLNGAG